MKLIIGLGNPGKQYELTRHNIGFMVLDRLAARWNVSWKKANKAECAERMGVPKVLLIKPQTYMNLSGEAVREYYDFYKVLPEDVLVVYDDLDLPFLRLKLRANGSSGGHNGIKSLITHLNSQEFPRAKVGIGKAPPEWRGADWVLSRFSSTEQTELQAQIDTIADAVEHWLAYGIKSAMNKYNASEIKQKKQGAENNANSEHNLNNQQPAQ